MLLEIIVPTKLEDGNRRRQTPKSIRGSPRLRSVYSSHRLIEARRLAMHAVIAAKIERNPKLLEVPRKNLKRWRTASTSDLPACLEEWSRILKRPWLEIAAIITEPSEEGARLRQSSPFAGVLTQAERQRIYDAFMLDRDPSRRRKWMRENEKLTREYNDLVAKCGTFSDLKE